MMIHILNKFLVIAILFAHTTAFYSRNISFRCFCNSMCSELHAPEFRFLEKGLILELQSY